MPKVDSISLEWLGEHKTFVIFFNTKQKFYIKDCPTEVLHYCPDFYNKENTLHDLRFGFKRAIEHAEDAMLRADDVILIEMSMTSDAYRILTDQVGGAYTVDRSDGFGRFLGSSSSGMKGPGFALEYQLAKKVTRGESVTYWTTKQTEFRGSNGRIYDQDNFVEVPYSVEKEESLKAVQAQLLQRVVDVTGFFNRDPLQIAQVLQEGNMLALGAGPAQIDNDDFLE